MCAGVQNVSRPMELCHEMSQCAPMVADVTASVAHQMYQGMPERLWTAFDTRGLAGKVPAGAVVLAIATSLLNIEFAPLLSPKILLARLASGKQRKRQYSTKVLAFPEG